MDPDLVGLTRNVDGGYHWDVIFMADSRLTRSGVSPTLAEAMECVRGAIENAQPRGAR